MLSHSVVSKSVSSRCFALSRRISSRTRLRIRAHPERRRGCLYRYRVSPRRRQRLKAVRPSRDASGPPTYAASWHQGRCSRGLLPGSGLGGSAQTVSGSRHRRTTSNQGRVARVDNKAPRTAHHFSQRLGIYPPTRPLHRPSGIAWRRPRGPGRSYSRPLHALRLTAPCGEPRTPERRSAMAGRESVPR